MKALETLHLNDAVGSKNKFDRSRTHLTTLEIGQITPLFHEDCVPGDSYTISNTNFSRLAPLAVPTYGSFYFKTATMFTPYYQVFEGAESFFGGKSISRGKSINLPFISKGEIFQLFAASPNNLSTIVTSSGYDFCYSVNNTVTYKKFTSFGKWVYKVIRSLGYQIPNIVSTTGSTTGSPVYNDKLNALPILCFFKSYNDYMSQSQRYDTSVISSYLESVRLGLDVSNFFTSSTGQIQSAGLLTLFSLVYLQYENDYFTSCWNSPNNPISSMSGELSSVSYSLGNQTDSITRNNSDTQISDATLLTSRALSFLSAFDRWIRRNNYSGSKDVERIYSRFGIKPEDYKAQYSHLVNTSSSIIQVGDVTSLSDTDVNNNHVVLGAYAGKGIMSDNTSFKFQSSDYGMLITLCWITVKPVYSNGYDRTVLKTSPLDFFNPEFDGLGGNPVPVQEIYVDRKNSTSQASSEKTIFGWNERYNEYKTGNLDQISGDFIIYDDMKSWHFDREDLKSLGLNLTAQNSLFNSVNNMTGSIQYNRIFNSETDQVDSMSDHFYLTSQFNVTAFRPMKNMNQVPDLGTGSTVVPRNGNTLN